MNTTFSKPNIALFLTFLIVFFTKNVFADLNSLVEAEIEMFKDGIQNKFGHELIDLADLLTGTGLTDEKLFRLVEERTKSEYSAHLFSPRDKYVARNLNALVRAYASFGREESRDFIVDLVDTSNSRGVRNRAHRLHPKLDWFKQRNKLMQNRNYYKEGQDLMTHRYMSLVKSSDSRMRRWAAEEIKRRGGTEQIVYLAMGEILKEEGKNIRSNVHLDALAWFCRILAKYDTENHKELLLAIQKDSGYHKKLQKYARF